MIQIQLKEYIVIKGKLLYNLEIDNNDFLKMNDIFTEIQTRKDNIHILIPNTNIKLIIYNYNPLYKDKKEME